MFLRELLRLLSVTLLHLLFLRIVVICLGHLLMFFFLLLLELLMILRLLGGELVLLLLILLVRCRVAGVWRCERVRLQFTSVTRRVRTNFSSISRTTLRAGARFICGSRSVTSCGIRRRSLIFAACCFGGHNASLEITGFGSSRDRWLTLIRRSP